MKTVIIGGGLAGLVSAFRAQEQGSEVVVLESSRRLGGTMRTVTLEPGVRIEAGPQSFRQGSVEMARLLGDLGLQDQVVEAHPNSRRRFILRNDTLHPLGAGTFRTGVPISRRGIARALFEPLVPRRTSGEPESVRSFIARRLGPTLADQVGNPVMAGIFGGDPAQLELSSAFPPFAALERDYGSMVLGMMRRPKPELPDWAPKTGFSLKGGVEQLIHALVDRVGAVCQLNRAVTSVQRQGTGWQVNTSDQSWSADQVVVTAPPWAARRFLPSLRAHLDGIPGAPIACVHLGWPVDAVPDPEGFGWLAPSSQRRDVLGAIWPTSMFPEQAPGWTLVRVMIGGARDPRAPFLGEQALVERAATVLREVQGIEVAPVLSHVAVHAHGIPQYVLGHQRRLAALRCSGLEFAGWGYTGIGMNHTVEAIQRAVAEI